VGGRGAVRWQKNLHPDGVINFCSKDQRGLEYRNGSHKVILNLWPDLQGVEEKANINHHTRKREPNNNISMHGACHLRLTTSQATLLCHGFQICCRVRGFPLRKPIFPSHRSVKKGTDYLLLLPCQISAMFTIII
jgi:hypothetical protein